MQVADGKMKVLIKANDKLEERFVHSIGKKSRLERTLRAFNHEQKSKLERTLRAFHRVFMEVINKIRSRVRINEFQRKIVQCELKIGKMKNLTVSDLKITTENIHGPKIMQSIRSHSVNRDHSQADRARVESGGIEIGHGTIKTHRSGKWEAPQSGQIWGAISVKFTKWKNA